MTGSRHLRSVLVANRGEIARRIMATARSMGLATVAVHSGVDQDAPFVAEADQAVLLPDGYLDVDAVVDAARRTGADCVHPGYGFLSENSALARAVIDAGVVWVGPSPDVIETMGDKIAAKAAAQAAGVPTLPSCTDPIEAETVGYPLLVKASAGGGGKGMRLVCGPEELDEALAAAQREAESAFGDNRVYLERYVARARHIEIQILGDSRGNLIHLGERECSIQRRHQKIIEETPSVRLDDALRDAMAGAAVDLGRSIGYQSAGTVEFIVDDDSGDFYFLEVNTRLQVEHPVTEAVTGVDLVRSQLLVAAGHAVTVPTPAEKPGGHAIEARLYAEDPGNGFLPATGVVEAWEPATGPGVRWDSGIEVGSVIGVDYDPLLAKVVAHGPTRAEATGRLVRALSNSHIGGVTTNRDFLVSTLTSDEFRSGDTTTDFVDVISPATDSATELVPDAALAGSLWIQSRNRAADTLWGFAPSNWRNGGLAPTDVSFTHGGRDEPITIAYRAARDGRFVIESGPTMSNPVEVVSSGPDHIDMVVDGVRRHHRVTGCRSTIHVQMADTTVSLQVVPRFASPGSDAPSGGLVAPMPGRVLDVRCQPGDHVTAGQVLVVLEAMKMEHHVQASSSGTVTSVLVSVGRQLSGGEPLVTIDESSNLEEPGEPGG